MTNSLIVEKSLMDIYEIVMKLVGPIHPIGETNADNARFENLKTLCTVTDQLVSAIDEVGYRHKDSQEYSVKRAADRARKFMDDLGITD